MAHRLDVPARRAVGRPAITQAAYSMMQSAMSGLMAITREISPAISQCQLTHLVRVPIDSAKASAQHDEYERALERLGCSIQRVSAGVDMPDSVFIEDTAVVLDELAILMWPGANARRIEVPAVAEALESHRPLARIQPPGTMDGGDVMVAGRTIFVGTSSRTNAAAIEQMRRIVAPLGYEIRPVAVHGCLHLKSAVTVVNDDTLLINPSRVVVEAFRGFDLIAVDPSEPSGANVVRVRDRLLCSAAFPCTRGRLEQRGFDVTAVDVSEIAKAEGAVTCCSLIFKELACPSPA